MFNFCGPVMDWRPVQGVPRLSPKDCWDRLQPPRDPTDGLSGRKWMDGCLIFVQACFISLFFKMILLIHISKAMYDFNWFTFSRF